MIKIKYLHTKVRPCEYKTRNKHFRKNIDVFSENLPKHEPYRRHDRYNGISWGPLIEFLESKIGENWNDVYSEILKKIKDKFKYQLKSDICHWFVYIPIYDEDFLPRNQYGRILYDTLFIDMNNILTKKSEEELKIDAKKLKRKLKLQEIFENNESEI